MIPHLLAISIGPVQGFISAARRTRDLWVGSHLLSEISKAVALSVFNHGGELIFPSPDDPANDLRRDDFLVANIILATLPADKSPQWIAENAKNAAQARWEHFALNAEKIANRALKFAGGLRADVWQHQRADIIEFYSAWSPLEAGKYKEARQRVMRLLAGRKNLRDFKPSEGIARLPKSSLDGLRETVLPDHARGSRDLRLAHGEQLDIVGVTKRAYGGQIGYPSISRIAADSWLQHMHHLAKQHPAIQQLHNALLTECENLALSGAVSRVSYAPYSKFPFEAAILFPERHQDIIEESGLTPSTFDRVKNTMDKLYQPSDEGTRALGCPTSYVAVLVADGDKMGAMISSLETDDENRMFSKALSSFAKKAQGIVQNHQGLCIYAGGDDVLALLPLDKCLSCAEALHNAFSEVLRDFTGRPTLSVGIAIGHSAEALEDLLAFGRAAEKDAKAPDADGLAIHFRPRGNALLRIRKQWKNKPVTEMCKQIGWFLDGTLPSKISYDLKELARLYVNWGQESDERRNALTVAIQADVRLLLKKKRSDKVADALEPLISQIRDADSLDAMARELMLSRRLAGMTLSETDQPSRAQ